MMRYTPAHEWVIVEGEEATIGISKPFQKELEEIVYIELPRVGHQIQQGEDVVVLESTKSAIDLTSPLSGVISAVNEKLREDPNWMSRVSEKEGWIFKLRIKNPSELEGLLDEESYRYSLKSNA